MQWYVLCGDDRCSRGADELESVLAVVVIAQICEAIAVVQQHEDTLRQVEIKYSDAPGSTSGDADAPGARELDIVLNFPSYGFHLLFEPETQLLRMVEVYDVTRIQLR